MLRFFHTLTIIIALCCFGTATEAQITVSGIVTDSLSDAPLAKAGVSLLRAGKTLKFCQTNAQGQFNIDVAFIKKGDELQTTSMGYEKKCQALTQPTNNRIAMAKKAFALNEVVVKSGPIIGRRDTVTYDLTRFASSRDNTLKDVLKKLPGVNVAKTGEIRYNGKSLSRLTIEGLDLSNGRYNQLTENIKAKDVKKAEIIENDQPIKALRKKVPSDNVAMNVVLKDSARDQLSITLRPYVLHGSPNHVAGNANAMQIGKHKQMMYHASYDRSGSNLSNNNIQFTADYGELTQAHMPQWYNLATMAQPIDGERLRFNTSQSYNVNLLTKTKAGNENKITAGYSRNVVRQTKSNFSLYYLGENPIEMTERENMLSKQDLFSLNCSHKTNTEASYGNMKFSLEATRNQSVSQFQSTGHSHAVQQVDIPTANIAASVYKVFSLPTSTLTWNSILDYHHARNHLYLDTLPRLSLTNNLWHTSHQLSWLKKRRYFTQSYSGGLEIENLHVQHNNTLIVARISPVWTYEHNKWRMTLSNTLKCQHYTRQQQTLLLPTTFFSAKYKPNNRTEWNATLQYSESTDGWTAFALNQRQVNYRTFYTASSFIPLNRTALVRLNHAYKRPIYEFFLHAGVSANRFWRNAVTDMQLNQGNYLYSYIKRNSHTDAMSANLDISKGFYQWHLKTSLTLSASYSCGESYSQGEMYRHHYRSIELLPSLYFYPAFMQVDYNAHLSFNKSKVGDKSLKTLFNWSQKLTLTSTIKQVDLSIVAVAYHNEIDGAPSANMMLADLRAVWRLKKVRLTGQLRNIFNQRDYRVTSYSGMGNFTNHYELRPREIVLSAQFTL